MYDPNKNVQPSVFSVEKLVMVLDQIDTYKRSQRIKFGRMLAALKADHGEQAASRPAPQTGAALPIGQPEADA